jgi:hypothetical protein
MKRLEAALPSSLVLSTEGVVDFATDRLSWKQLKVRYAGNEYTSSGTVSSFRQPVIGFGIYSQETQVEGSVRLRDKVLEITRVKAASGKSEASIQGTVDISRAPALPCQLSFSANLDMAGMERFIASPKWKEAKPAGAFTVQSTASGDLSHPDMMKVNALVKSASFTSYGLNAGNLNVDYRQAEGTAKALFNFSFYDGTANGDVQAELAKNGIPYSLKTTVQGVNVEKLKADTAFRQKDLSGILSAESLFTGQMAQKPAVIGKGKVAIANGRLWQLDVLAGLKQFVLPELFSVTFDRGSTEFLLDNDQLTLDKLNLLSSTVQIVGKGSTRLAGAEQPIEGLVSIQVSENILPNLGKLRTLAGKVLGQTGKVVGVKISGTRQRPKYDLTQPFFSDVWRFLQENRDRHYIFPATDSGEK